MTMSMATMLMICKRVVARSRTWPEIFRPTDLISRRAAFSGSVDAENADDLRQFIHGNSRRVSERADSLTEDILRDRRHHHIRMSSLDPERYILNMDVVETLGLGKKRRKTNVYRSFLNSTTYADEKATTVGAGGFATHLSSANGGTSSEWPIFKHILPEVALAGHSNSGKSTLVNALVGVLPKKGPARISDRAGWTDQICFYQLGKRPPVMILADLPGYGHAVATSDQKREWKRMIRDYLGNRTVLSVCCVLVDSTRGLCAEDTKLITFLMKRGVPLQIVLTKCDLLSPESVAQSMAIVEDDVHDLFHDSINNNNSNNNENRKKSGENNAVKDDASLTKEEAPKGDTNDRKHKNKQVREEVFRGATKRLIMPVSAATGAGIQQLWQALRARAFDDTKVANRGNNSEGNQEEDQNYDLPAHAVREHRNADLLRRRDLLVRIKKKH